MGTRRGGAEAPWQLQQACKALPGRGAGRAAARGGGTRTSRMCTIASTLNVALALQQPWHRFQVVSKLGKRKEIIINAQQLRGSYRSSSSALGAADACACACACDCAMRLRREGRSGARRGVRRAAIGRGSCSAAASCHVHGAPGASDHVLILQQKGLATFKPLEGGNGRHGLRRVVRVRAAQCVCASHDGHSAWDPRRSPTLDSKDHGTSCPATPRG